MPRRRVPLSPLALAVGVVALVLALTGTAFAAGLAANSVGTKQLKSNAVKTAKIKDGAVTGAKIKDGAVTGAKVTDASLTGADVADGSIAKADIGAGVLPSAPLTIDHNVPVGTALPAVIAGGVSITPDCSLDVMDKVARFTIQAATVMVAMDTAGLMLETVGTTKNPVSIFQTGTSVFDPQAHSSGGDAALASFEGVVRAGSGPWLRLSLSMRSNNVQTNCQLRAVITVLG
jgi:hypothetical protein